MELQLISHIINDYKKKVYEADSNDWKNLMQWEDSLLSIYRSFGLTKQEASTVFSKEDITSFLTSVKGVQSMWRLADTNSGITTITRTNSIEKDLCYGFSVPLKPEFYHNLIPDLVRWLMMLHFPCSLSIPQNYSNEGILIRVHSKEDRDLAIRVIQSKIEHKLHYGLPFLPKSKGFPILFSKYFTKTHPTISHYKDAMEFEGLTLLSSAIVTAFENHGNETNIENVMDELAFLVYTALSNLHIHDQILQEGFSLPSISHSYVAAGLLSNYMASLGYEKPKGTIIDITQKKGPTKL